VKKSKSRTLQRRSKKQLSTDGSAIGTLQKEVQKQTGSEKKSRKRLNPAINRLSPATIPHLGQNH